MSAATKSSSQFHSKRTVKVSALQTLATRFEWNVIKEAGSEGKTKSLALDKNRGSPPSFVRCAGQILIRLSLPPVTICLPSGDAAMLQISLMCPFIWSISCQVLVSQTRMDSSALEEKS